MHIALEILLYLIAVYILLVVYVGAVGLVVAIVSEITTFVKILVNKLRGRK